MRAVIVSEPGGVDALQVGEVADPVAADGEVLIRVRAAGVNRADLLQREGHYPPPPGASEIIGLECSGVVEALGPGVERGDLAVGQEVVALLAGGGYAELVAVPHGQVAGVPEGVDLVEAGGLVEVAATVWANVFMTANLRAGETLLVHGGASGIGTMAIQLAVARGARVVVTVGTEEKARFCRDLGATAAVVYADGDWTEKLRAAGLPTVDVVLDTIGAKYLRQNISMLARNGRIVTIGMQGGTKAEINLASLLGKNASLAAASLRSRPVAEKSAIIADLVENVWPLLADGTIRPIVHATYPLDDVRAAQSVLEESSHTGKVLLLP